MLPMLRDRLSLSQSLAGLLLLACAVLPQGALAQERDMSVLMDRLERLERDMRTLNIQVARGGPPAELTSGAPGGQEPSAGGVAGLHERIATLEEELRRLTGKVEEANWRTTQAGQRLEKALGDFEYRLGTLEKGGAPGQPTGGASGMSGMGGPPPAVPGQDLGKGVLPFGSAGTIKQADPAARPPQPLAAKGPAGVDASGQGTTVITSSGKAETAPTAKAGALPVGSSKDQYNHAFDLLRRSQYDEAELALSAFVEAHPNDPLTENARYWLAETHYVRADYVRAAEGFLKAYGAAPKGGKAPDALLKLGMSMAQLDKKDQACTTFAKLGREFPDASATVKKKADSEKARLGCK